MINRRIVRIVESSNRSYELVFLFEVQFIEVHFTINRLEKPEKLCAFFQSTPNNLACRPQIVQDFKPILTFSALFEDNAYFMRKIFRRFTSIRFAVIGPDGRGGLSKLIGNDTRRIAFRKGVKTSKYGNSKGLGSRLKVLFKIQSLVCTAHNYFSHVRRFDNSHDSHDSTISLSLNQFTNSATLDFTSSVVPLLSIT